MGLKAKFYIIIGLLSVLFLGVIWELVQSNKIEKSEKEAAQERNRALEHSYLRIDSLLRENGIEGLELVRANDGLIVDLKIHTNNLQDHAKAPTKRFIDVMSYTDAQKRDTISKSVRDQLRHNREFFEVFDRFMEEQRHYQDSLFP